jgi:hypothetical protein
MSYVTQSQLEQDNGFRARCRAAFTEQSLIFKDSQLVGLQALALDLLQDKPGPTVTFIRMLAGSPGFAGVVEVADGVIDSSLVNDTQLLSAVQTDFPIVADIYYPSQGDPDGS